MRPALFLFLAAAAHGQTVDAGWKALLHYEGGASEADGALFFLAPDGKTNPQAELEATLNAFRDTTEGEGERWQHPICRFPARYQYLKTRGFDVPSPRPCPRFDEWRKELDPEGVVLIYADAFLNNPASMYGHTFLRLKKKGSQPGEELLDYTINFAGTPDTNNAMFYAVKGLIGAFPGNYSTMPYYLKVAEYNDLEKRDLWEYELDLSSAAVDMLVRHAWEMGSTHFDYWFLDENCSYQLLTLIDGAEPSLQLARDFPLWVIPIDTVRSFLDRPGLVKSVRRRPSLAAEAAARRKRRPRDGLEAEALRLEADYDKWKLAGKKADPARGKQLLAQRAKLGLGPIPWEVPEAQPPHAAHRSERAGLGFGAGKRSTFEELWWRAALHDLAERPDGYVPGSQLEMGDLRLRLDNDRGKPYVETFDLVDIVSLSPGRFSWKAAGGVDQAKELGCVPDACHVGRVNAGLGLAANAGRHYAYVFAEGQLDAGAPLRKDWRAGGGGTAGVLLTLPRTRLQAEGTLLGFDQGPEHERLRLTASFDLARELQLRFTYDRERPEREGSVVILFHY